MRVMILYLRARRTGYIVMGMGALTLISWVWANAMIQLPVLRGNLDAYIPVIFFVPLVAASLIGVGSYSPFGEVERTASLPLPLLRLSHLASLVLLALVLLTFSASGWDREWAELTLARNLAGFTGLALLGAVLLGGLLSWVLPLGFGIITYGFSAVGPAQFARWAWPLQPIGDISAVLMALSLLVAGSATFCWIGGRESPGEAS